MSESQEARLGGRGRDGAPGEFAETELGGGGEGYEAPGWFVEAVVSDLTRPLTVVAGAVASLRRRLSAAEVAEVEELLEVIGRSSSEAVSALHALAAMTGQGAGSADAAVLVRHAVEDLRRGPLAGRLTSVSSGGPVAVVGDRSGLRSLFVSVLIAAAEVSAAGAPIAVHVEPDGDEQMRLIVETDSRELSDPASKSGHMPVGLSMSVASSLAWAHGGSLQHNVAEEPGRIRVAVAVPTGPALASPTATA